ncbi:hypothetical protein BGZ75_010441, partial [Mortierella antarctica]
MSSQSHDKPIAKVTTYKNRKREGDETGTYKYQNDQKWQKIQAQRVQSLDVDECTAFFTNRETSPDKDDHPEGPYNDQNDYKDYDFKCKWVKLVK